MSKHRGNFQLPRIESEILNILNHTLKYVIYDEKLREVSFTYVKLDPGKTFAHIYVDTFHRENLDKILVKLNESKGVFRRELSQNMQLRKLPEIRFERDETIDRNDAIEAILNQKKN
ncbi:MAG: 30S ribosome-binding factor RbfA [Mycoplasmataceae bacterium]|jgi:ribosome-binding factor A|nr:30S ribosome-binding factor RbfA [Mycoplasmataceae bacterium]